MCKPVWGRRISLVKKGLKPCRITLHALFKMGNCVFPASQSITEGLGEDFDKRQEFQVTQQQPKNAQHQLHASETKLKTAQRDFEKAQQELRRTQEELQTTQKKLQTLQQRFGSAQQQLQVAKQEIQDTKQELQTTQQELLATQKQLQATQQEFRATKQGFQTTKQEFQATQQELQTTKQRLQDAQQGLQTAQQQPQNTQQELRTAQENLRSAQQQVNFLKQELHAAYQNKDQTYQMQSELAENLKQRLSVRNAEQEQLKLQLQSLQLELQDVKQQLEKSAQENSYFRRECLPVLEHNLNENFKKREEQYHKKINSLREKLDCYIKQREKDWEEISTLTNNLTELKSVYESSYQGLEKQKNQQIQILQKSLSKKELELLDLHRNSAHPQNQKQSTPSHHGEQQRQTEQGKAHLKPQPEDISAKNEHQSPEDPYVTKSLAKIAEVCKDMKQLEKEVLEFSGTAEDMTYLHLKELLIRSVLRLDNVETEGYLVIRERRKEAIQYVHKLVEELRKRAV